jgi:hypothetical protein
MILCIPAIDAPMGPTLGPAVWAWIRKNLCYGPGDLLGQLIRDDDEWLAILCRLYEVWPRGHQYDGRRRFARGCVSRRKGRAKTELAAWVTAAEMHQRAPVRCIGWDERGCTIHGKAKGAERTCQCQPKGGPVTDPYIPLVAYTEEQGETTIYGALKAILERSAVVKDFDIGLARVMRKDGTGRAEALAAEPNARDGARTTFQVFEETHRWYTPRLKAAYQTMSLNIPKRRTADAWSLEVTTSYKPGQGSIAERTMEHARNVAEGRVQDMRLFFSHRQAREDADLSTPEGLREAVLEATGEVAAGWSNVEGICSQFSDPNLEPVELRRLWLNQVVKGAERAFDPAKWAANAVSRTPTPGAFITLGFDGSISRDSTGIVATEVESGWQWVLAKWERPLDLPREQPWEVPSDEVNAAMADAFARFDVWRLYADKPHWETYVDAWSGEFGEERVINWPTNQHRKMAASVRSFSTAVNDGTLSHSGDAAYARHVGNAHRKDVGATDDGEPLFVIVKEGPMSPLKIDLAVAGVLSWQARQDAVAAGAKPRGPRSFAVEWLE